MPARGGSLAVIARCLTQASIGFTEPVMVGTSYHTNVSAPQLLLDIISSSRIGCCVGVSSVRQAAQQQQMQPAHSPLEEDSLQQFKSDGYWL